MCGRVSWGFRLMLDRLGCCVRLLRVDFVGLERRYVMVMFGG